MLCYTKRESTDLEELGNEVAADVEGEEGVEAADEGATDEEGGGDGGGTGEGGNLMVF